MSCVHRDKEKKLGDDVENNTAVTSIGSNNLKEITKISKKT